MADAESTNDNIEQEKCYIIKIMPEPDDEGHAYQAIDVTHLSDNARHDRLCKEMPPENMIYTGIQLGYTAEEAYQKAWISVNSLTIGCTR